jgi:hypothetical protein
VSSRASSLVEETLEVNFTMKQPLVLQARGSSLKRDDGMSLVEQT